MGPTSSWRDWKEVQAVVTKHMTEIRCCQLVCFYSLMALRFAIAPALFASSCRSQARRRKEARLRPLLRGLCPVSRVRREPARILPRRN